MGTDTGSVEEKGLALLWMFARGFTDRGIGEKKKKGDLFGCEFCSRPKCSHQGGKMERRERCPPIRTRGGGGEKKKPAPVSGTRRIQFCGKKEEEC